MQDQATVTTQKRLRILGDDEIQALYGRPRFTDDERQEYFALSPAERATLEQLHSVKSRIYFTLQLGYFKSHHMFFVFDLPDVEEDARYVREQYFPDFQLDDLGAVRHSCKKLHPPIHAYDINRGFLSNGISGADECATGGRRSPTRA